MTYPKDFIIDEGEVLESFDDVTDWTATNGTAAADTAYFKTGTQGVKATATAGADCYVAKTVAWDMSEAGSIRLWAYVHTDPTTTIDRISLHLCNSSNGANRWAKDWWPNEIKAGWNHLSIHQDDMTISDGAPSWESGIVLVRLRVKAVAAQTPSVTWAWLKHQVVGQPAVIFQLDDCFDAVYSHALTPMQAQGFKGTVMLAYDEIGTTNKVTLTQLRALDAAGWAICNHTYTHPDLTTLSTVADVVSEVQNMIEYMEGAGWGDGARYLCYPAGGVNSTVTSGIEALLMRACVWVDCDRNCSTPVDDVLLLPSRQVFNTDALATVEGWVDEAADNGTTCILVFHDLVDTPSTSTEWAIADFESLVAYVAASGVPVMTLPEWFENMRLIVPGSQWWKPLTAASIYPDTNPLLRKG